MKEWLFRIMKMNTVDMAPSFQARTATVENVNHECFDG